jgi:ribosomal protein L13E
MTILPELNIYTRAISGRKTNETPSERWSSHEGRLKVSECGTIKREIGDLTLAREKRKKRDEEEMYEGLRNFNGRQRGWNSERESDRQQTIRNYHETEHKKLQAQVEKDRAAAESSRPPLKIQRVNSEELMEVMEEVRSQREIQVMALEDLGDRLMEQARMMMMSRNVDMDAIIAEAHGRSRKDSRAASMVLESSTPSRPAERNRREGRIGALNGSSPGDVPSSIESLSPEASPSHQPLSRSEGLAEEGALKENDLDLAYNTPTDERPPKKRSRPFGTDITEEVLAREKKARDNAENART